MTCLLNSLTAVDDDSTLRLMMGPPGRDGDTAHFWTQSTSGDVNEHTPEAVTPEYQYRGREVDPDELRKEIK